MNPTFANLVFASLVGTAITAIPARADLYWSGTGNWDTSTSNWGSVSGGPYNASVWNNATPDSAVFEGTAGTVTLLNDIDIQNLAFNLPTAATAGYSIGNVGELNTLNFSGTKTLTLTATGTGTNQDATIRAGITGSPTMNIAGRAANSVNQFQLLPGLGVTQTIGTLNMLNTFASNKQLVFGGESTGNVVNTVTWANTANQMFLTKAGTGSWTINNNLSFLGQASRLYVENGTLTVLGTNNFFTHKIGVNTNRGTTFTASGGSAKLIASGTWTIGDNREYFYVQNGGTLAPGAGIDTLTVRWNANTNATTTHAQFNMQTGSTYEWQILSSTSTDVIDVQTGGSNFANLTLGNITLKIQDAGAATPIAFTDQLTLFTYETAQPVARSIGTIGFNTDSLGAGWTVGSLMVTDDNAGRIYLTGLQFAPIPEPSAALLGVFGGIALFRRRR